VFYPESPAVVIHDGSSKHTIVLPGGFGYDSGRALFHRETSSGLACASCHPEGRDDGLVWEFAGIGLRRTQSLAGNILARAPYHWNGDMADLDQLMHDVFQKRMGGGGLTRSQLLSLGPWLDRIPAPKSSASADVAAIERGRAVFDSIDVGCANCHSGPNLTNNMLLNVGTGGLLKVPSLIGVSARAPFMHDGCATTLRDRFGACGGGDAHGKTSTLTEAQLADLIGYLESL
jgi:mono/diheme cytochrome c family protein